MATISMLLGTANNNATAALYGKKVKVIYNLVDWAKVEEANGAVAVAVNDIVKVLRIPAGSKVLDAGCKVIEASNVTSFKFGLGNSLAGGTFIYVADNTGDMKTTGYSTEAFTGTYTQVGNLATFSVPVTKDPRGQRFTSEGDIRIQIGSHTGTLSTTGVVGVYAVIAPISPFTGMNIDDTDQAGVPQS